MPIINRQDAAEVEHYIARFFAASSAERVQALRRLFVEKLDFAGATGAVSLANAAKTVTLPPSAERIASMEGLHVVYVPLSGDGPDRVRKAEAAAAAKLIADTLHGDLLLVMTNPSGSQLHVIYPSFVGSTPSLRRMIIERDLPRRTAVQQFSNIYWNWKDSGIIGHAVEQAFDVEAVTKDFFERYKVIFDGVMSAVKGFDQSEEEAEAKKLFVQTLFNRLMFIYFISRKGWLTFDRDKDYLNALWRAHEARPDQNKNFYVDRLRLLFFAALNNPNSQDLTSEPEARRLLGTVPFLNGGLFDRTDEDNRTRVLVPDDCIQEILSKLFDRFNFTVMESTPFDLEVAVDPEMLGKVFEELVTGRHESGSYYTPRPVVSFMCREALKGYLETQNTGASTEAIAAFVDHKDTSKLTLSSAPKIGEALARVKVVDPACGSGAYLLGMMQELVELMTALYSAQLSHQAQDLYNLKLRIIQQNLYGADIDQFAVNIAMLRLWLSLAIEYDGKVEDLPPLPNLDFKIVCGDSLLGPDPSPENFGDLFRHRVHELAGQLATLKDEHMGATGQEKANLTKDIEGLKAQLRDALADSAAPGGAVDWRVEFAEVFDQNGGFDIAVANPPYLSSDSLGPTKDLLRVSYGDATTGRSDLYAFFYLRGVHLLRSGGVHVFVCSNTWLDAQFGIPLIGWLMANTNIEAVLESELERQFSTAAINTVISIISKIQPSNSDLTTFATLMGPFDASIAEWLPLQRGQTTKLIRATKKTHEELRSELTLFESLETSPKWGGRFLRAPKIYGVISDALKQQGKTLGDYAKGERYLNTGGADGFFILTDVVPVSAVIAEVTARSKEGAEWKYPRFKIERQFLQPGVKGADSNTLVFQEPDCWILSVPENTKISQFQVREYIKWGEKAGFNDRSVTRTQNPWWRPPLQARSGAPILWGRTHGDYHRVFLNPRLMITVRFFRLHPISGLEPKVLWALLNSTIYALLKEIHGRRGLGFGGLETGLVDILPLPVLRLTPDISHQLTERIAPISARKTKPLASEVQMTDRRELDEVIVRAIGLPASVLDDVYEATVQLVAARATKAGSVGRQ